MRLLLDTHAFLWFVLGDSKISGQAIALISEASNEKLVSMASVWEIAIKVSLNKYALRQPLETFLHHAGARTGFHLLPIEPRHASVVARLPFHHRDPFDRMIVAQAIADGLHVVSCDTQFDAYGVSRLW